MRTAKIYALTCPITETVRYVGKTSMSVDRRLINHVGSSRRHPKTPKELWIADLLKRGSAPGIQILDEVSVEAASDAERRWAASFATSVTLLNHPRIGAGGPGVGRVEWTEETLSLLGRIADSKIAKMLGCDRKTVSYKRECLGIPASFDRTDNVPPPRNGGWNRIEFPPAIIDRLGKEPDYVIARAAGVQKSAIARRRRELGIQDYATATGNDGRMKSERPHPRWVARQAHKDAATLSPDADLVTDDIWQAVEDIMPPPPKHGILRVDNRSVLRGVLWVLRSGAKWADLPAAVRCGTGSGVFRRLCTWIEKGHWPEIEDVLKGRLAEPNGFDWTRARLPSPRP